MTMIQIGSNRTKSSSFNISSALDSNATGIYTATAIGQRVCDVIQNRSSSWLCRVSILLFVLFSWFYFFFNSEENAFHPNPFDQPFCDPDGTCHEKSYVASPRTFYSAWNKEQYDDWWKYYESLNERVELYANKRQAIYDSEKIPTRNSRPLILLGDSITESWAGTGMGIPKVRANGVPKVLEEELSASSGLDPIVLGMAGDQTQHLLYRLQNGHMRAAQLLSSQSSPNKGSLFYDPSTIFVVMIGTNNLGSGELPGPTTKGILAIIEFLLEQTSEAGCHVMIFQVLPRGDGKKTLPKLCPPRCSSTENKTPYTSFLPPIQKVNEGVRDGIQRLGKTYSASSRLQLVDCGTEFLNDKYDDQKDNVDGNYEVKEKELMPDLLHPNVVGHRILAKCIRNYVDQINE
jgi:lysophospholipase L1-like esterase